MGSSDTYQIMKLIDIYRFLNNWGKLSFFDNTLREIMLMDYLLVMRIRNIEENIELGTYKKWLKYLDTFIAYAREIVGGISLDKSLAKVNFMSEEIYLFHELYKGANDQSLTD